MNRKPIWIIVFTILLDTLGVGILVPVVPHVGPPVVERRRALRLRALRDRDRAAIHGAD